MVQSYCFFYTEIKSRDSEIESRQERAHLRAFAGVGLRFCTNCTSLLAARCPARVALAPALSPARGMIGRVLYTADVTRPAGPHTDIQCRTRRRQQNNRSNRMRRREDTANGPNSLKVNRRKGQGLLYR